MSLAEPPKRKSKVVYLSVHQTHQKHPAWALVLLTCFLPDMQPGQHCRRPAAKHPDGEEDDEQRGGEHHLASVCGGVTDGQGESHRPT